MLSANTSGDVVKCDAIMTYEAKGISADHKRRRSSDLFIAASGHFGGAGEATAGRAHTEEVVAGEGADDESLLSYCSFEGTMRACYFQRFLSRPPSLSLSPSRFLLLPHSFLATVCV